MSSRTGPPPSAEVFPVRKRDAMETPLAPVVLAVLLLTILGFGHSASAQTETVLYSFAGGADGASPYAGLVLSPEGHFYGTTYFGGGTENGGTAFQLAPSNGTWSETVLYSFGQTAADGYNPEGNLILNPAGDLYGTTFYGAGGPPADDGTVFELAPSNNIWSHSVLYEFDGGSSGGDGTWPAAGVVSDLAGNLYGTTVGGGSTGNGTVFKLVSSNGGWLESVIYSFQGGTDGSSPWAGLILDSAGDLYGTTTDGGSMGYGTVFELTPSNGGWSESVLYSFEGGPDGEFPLANLASDPTGNLYGTTEYGGSTNCPSGCGTVFKLTHSNGGWSESLLYSFQGGNDGEAPFIGGLIFDSGGNLYGTTWGGGSGDWGTVFRLTPLSGGWSETVLHSFTASPDGAEPAAGLTLDAEGNLYGTTVRGGTAGEGIVYEISGVSYGAPAVELSPSYLVFPSAGGTLPVTVTNTGSGTLSITTPPGFSGFNSFDFSVASGTTCANGSTVTPGASCVINVTFAAKPVTTSAESANLLIYDNASGSPQSVPVSGGAGLTNVSPNPIPGSTAMQLVTISGNNFEEGATVNWQDLTTGKTGTPLATTFLSDNQVTVSKTFSNSTAAWEFQVANPTGSPSNWYSFEVLPSQYSYIKDDYPFQNAPFDSSSSSTCTPSDTIDPYIFCFRECTSYVAWRMNRDAGTTNPAHPFFTNGMGTKGNWGEAYKWNTHATALGYAVGKTPQVGDIAQWVNGCGGTCSSGHVAYVEQVTTSGGKVSSIDISEYNYPDETKPINISHELNVRTLSTSNQYYPQNFIHVLYLTLSANSLNFGNQEAGTTSSQTVTITNPGTAAVSITALALTGNTADFSLQTGSGTCKKGSSIPAGSSCQITVEFTPQKAQSYSATVTMTDTDGPSIKQVITVVGTGT